MSNEFDFPTAMTYELQLMQPRGGHSSRNSVPCKQSGTKSLTIALSSKYKFSQIHHVHIPAFSLTVSA